MQASGSFSSTRSGKPRPADIISSRVSASEARPWPSPSFNSSLSLDSAMASADGPSTSADPLRPSSKAFALRSPISIDGLPPTPVTAGLKLSPIDGSKQDGESSAPGGVQQRMRLPGLSVMLNVDSPPPSAEPELGSSEQEVLADGDMQQPPALRPSATGVFSGQPAEWTTGSGSMAPPAAPRARAVALPMIRRGTWHPSSSSSNSWRSMPTDDKVEGLGLQLYGADSPMADEMSGLALTSGDMTPRLPSLASPSATPTLHSWAPVMPGAPRLSSGRFETMAPSSPISPALDARWQAPLRFDSTPFAAEPAAPTSWTPRAVRAAEMERERTVCIEGGMPRMDGLRGLGIDFEHAPHNAVAGPSRLGRGVVAQPPLRDVMQEDAPASAIRSTPALVRTLSASSPGVGPTRSTGLTPHVEKTRLTPYSSASRSKNASPPSTAASGATAGAESPSLRTQSKARSDLLRERAMAAAASLPADGPAAHHASSPTAQKHKSSSGRPGSAPASASASNASPPKRRGLSERKAGANRDGGDKADMSPWGVFDLGSSDDGAWTPLGPPTACGSAVKGEVSNGKAPAGRAAHEAAKGKENIGLVAKQRRAGGTSEPGSKAHGAAAGKQGAARRARKDVFGSTSPTETAAARRFVSMR